MNASDLLGDLCRHTEWADALVWSTVLAHPNLLEDATLHERLHHIHLVQRAFLRVWRGEPLDFEGTQSLRGESLARWARAYHADVPRFLARLDDTALDRVVDLPWSARVAEHLASPFVAPRLGETVAQVAWHSAHHRGQVSARIHELGVEPPLTDFIAWVWSGKPAASWPTGTD